MRSLTFMFLAIIGFSSNSFAFGPDLDLICSLPDNPSQYRVSMNIDDTRVGGSINFATDGGFKPVSIFIYGSILSPDSEATEKERQKAKEKWNDFVAGEPGFAVNDNLEISEGEKLAFLLEFANKNNDTGSRMRIFGTNSRNATGTEYFLLEKNEGNFRLFSCDPMEY